MTVLAPDYLQAVTAPFERLRGSFDSLPIQEGVVPTALDPAPLKVGPRVAGGANMSVDIARGTAWVQGDHHFGQGLYHIVNDAVANLTIPSNSSGNPRVDTIIARVLDSHDNGDGSDGVQFEVVQGTPGAGAVLIPATWAPSAPNTAIPLANVLVANGASSITATEILDRRRWAHGAFYTAVNTAGDITLSNTSFADVLAADFTRRVELRTGWYRVSLYGNLVQGASNTLRSTFRVTANGTSITQPSNIVGSNQERNSDGMVAGGAVRPLSLSWHGYTTGGTVLIALQYKQTLSSPASTLRASSTYPLRLVIEEMMPGINGGP